MNVGRSRLFVIRPSTTNIGNDLIALATERLLQATWPEPFDLVSLPATGSDRGVKGGGLDARNVYEINQLGDGLLVGCGNLFENGGLHVDEDALEALTVPLCLFAISGGRIHGRSGALVRRTDACASSMIGSLCAAADPVLVREQATARELERIGVGPPTVVGCPTLFLDRLMPQSPDGDTTLAGTALVSVRNPGLMSIPYDQRERVRVDVRRIVDDLAGDYDNVALLCHDYRDIAFAAAYPDVPSLYTEDARRYISWLRGCAFSVTYRLHAFLPSIAYGVQSLHISYDERAEAMVDTLGVDAWNIRMSEVADVPGELAARRRLLTTVESPKHDAAPAVDRLYAQMAGGVTAFAGTVARARARSGPPVPEASA